MNHCSCERSDIATMDESGYVRIEGRLKDMVIRGGENIYPLEIEQFLYRHPKIADVQVWQLCRLLQRTIVLQGDAENWLEFFSNIISIIPVELRSPGMSLDIFKDKLKTFLFRTVY